MQTISISSQILCPSLYQILCLSTTRVHTTSQMGLYMGYTNAIPISSLTPPVGYFELMLIIKYKHDLFFVKKGVQIIALDKILYSFIRMIKRLHPRIKLRCIITFLSASKFVLPIAYNSLVQGFIYNHIDEVLSSWLHNEAISFEKRRFRFFTFSRLIGSYRLKEKKIEFSGPVKLYIGTIHKVVLQSLVENLLKNPSIKLGESSCEIQSIEIEPIPASNGPTLVRTLSPITIYSTLKGADGKKKTYYYSPFEKDWEGKLLDNLRRR